MPFIGAALVKDFALMIEDDAFDLRLNLETLRYASEAINDRLERFLANRRRFSELRFLTSFSFFDGVDFVSRHLQPQSKLGFQRGGIVFAECACFEQLAFVNLRY